LSALAIAGGPTYRASKSTILIHHPGEPALKEYAMDAALPILPGDIHQGAAALFLTAPPTRRHRCQPLISRTGPLSPGAGPVLDEIPPSN
jgi:hypothetical protein